MIKFRDRRKIGVEVDRMRKWKDKIELSKKKQ